MLIEFFNFSGKHMSNLSVLLKYNDNGTYYQTATCIQGYLYNLQLNWFKLFTNINGIVLPYLDHNLLDIWIPWKEM